MTNPLTIQVAESGDFDAVAEIARLLPGAFNAEGVQALIADATSHRCFIAKENGKPLGFIVWLETHIEIELLWMGVDPQNQNKGIGIALVRRAEQAATTQRVILLKTADPQYLGCGSGLDSETFRDTLRFWKRRGYTRIATIGEYWSRENGAILLLKRLRHDE